MPGGAPPPGIVYPLVLCKRDDRVHVNLGDGPPAEANAFLPAVQAQLRPSGGNAVFSLPGTGVIK